MGQEEIRSCWSYTENEDTTKSCKLTSTVDTSVLSSATNPSLEARTQWSLQLSSSVYIYISKVVQFPLGTNTLILLLLRILGLIRINTTILYTINTVCTSEKYSCFSFENSEFWTLDTYIPNCCNITVLRTYTLRHTPSSALSHSPAPSGQTSYTLKHINVISVMSLTIAHT